MLVLVTYDVSTTTAEGKKRLRKVAQLCQNYGQRVQNSVFECIVDTTQFTALKISLKNVINVEEDSLRFYRISGSNYKNKVEHVGAKASIDLDGPLLF
ncbi:CRISPR-associated endonuclease Cas2 [Shimazuella kribbensis]|uniref:CRISPR-associated endonuclease Cas2 n=1 Tax=Shimazuella kribbensis TaxID=139808 RepID=UPI000420B0E8|nr:CRISPR-associated endonuclease Cas2 [Shimazuella kribbensis]